MEKVLKLNFYFHYRYPVSNFSYRLLDSMFLDPLFDVAALNPGLYRKARSLDKCRKFRQQLNYLKDFLFNCRFAKEYVYFIFMYTYLLWYLHIVLLEYLFQSQENLCHDVDEKKQKNIYSECN